MAAARACARTAGASSGSGGTSSATTRSRTCPRIDAGDTVEVHCTFDNSPSNPDLRAYRAGLGLGFEDLVYGSLSINEMCHVYFDAVVPSGT